ncbi:MAG: DUF4249 domain-containing protein [Bacteroidia bacterium]
MKTFRIYFLPLLASLMVLSACDLQKQVELDLPEYEPLLVAESYLQPGNPYIVTLLESSDFYGDIQIQFVRDAEVVISHNGINDTLVPFEIPLDFALPPGFADSTLLQQLAPILGEGAYLYTSIQSVPPDYDSEFTLSVKALDGRSLSAKTFIPAPVEVDSIIIRYDEDSVALMLTQFQDDPSQANYYRRVLERRVVDTIISETGDTTYNYRSRTEQDFFTNDEINNGEVITFGTLFEFSRGDSLINTIYHVTEDYSRFVETRDAAIIASFSPFAPPTVVYSNIEGGLGIFTGFTFTQKLTIID